MLRDSCLPFLKTTTYDRSLDIHMIVQSFFLFLNSLSQWFLMVANFTPEILKKCWVFCCLLAPNGSFTLQTSSSCGSLTACSRAHSTVQTHAEWATFIISREILFFPPQQPRGGWVTHTPLCYISVPVALHCPPHSWLHSPTDDLLFQLQLHISLCTVKS